MSIMHRTKRHLRASSYLGALALASLSACVTADLEAPEDTEWSESEAAFADTSADTLAPIPGEGEARIVTTPVKGEATGDDATDKDLQANVWNGYLYGWHSDEDVGYLACPSGYVANGFDCSGSYCDNVALHCRSFSGASVSNSHRWSPWFEHNGTYRYACNSNEKITAIDCWGDNCDNISIRCTYVSNLNSSSCYWRSAWYSEEDPSAFVLDPDQVLQGIWCSGTHCDNKRFRVCFI